MSDINIHIEGTCPEEFAVCMTNDEWADFIIEYELELGDELSSMEIGDAEAVANFTWEILFLSPWELAYIALPMSVLAFYGLSIYAVFKWLQKKFS
ncbi:MAG: hypothetical protein CMA07_06640 [Euryarchaeota archaeon]|nr:hypothetical protein [Euryarchaeota archaeon]|tara:strand:- start:4794 stop:5081 length:288 start_codon:yes stop_codon:yes gene_type:complete